jgi:SRSO17 transposase
VTDDDLTAWIAGLDALFARVAGRFYRVEPRRRARGYVRGLLAPLAGKNGWTLAEAAGDATPDGMQRLLNAATWDADGVRDDLRAYAVEHFGEREGVLVVDETGFLKKGNKSAGVQRRYSGTAGRVENCQLGVFLAYTTSKGRAVLDRELYLPKSWTADRMRCREAAVPDEVEFATKTVLAQAMLVRALDVEECFQTAKTEVGLDHYQVRRYDAWYRHITRAMVAHTYLAVTAAIAPSPGSGLIPITLGEAKRLLAHLITTIPDRAMTWAWSYWRRRHQHRAQISHYQRRQRQDHNVRLEY